MQEKVSLFVYKLLFSYSCWFAEAIHATEANVLTPQPKKSAPVSSKFSSV
jgi:hypothetical protein